MASFEAWDTMDLPKKRRLINQIRTFLSRYFAMTDKHKLLRAVFTKNFDHGLHVRSKDYLAKSAIIENISQELNTLRRKEHQSGAFQAVLSACCGSNISSLELARQLKVHRHTVRKVFYILKKPLIISFLNSLFSPQTKAMKWRHVRRTGVVYRKIIKKPVIKRVKKAPQLDDACKRFMESVFVPSR